MICRNLFILSFTGTDFGSRRDCWTVFSKRTPSFPSTTISILVNKVRSTLWPGVIRDWVGAQSPSSHRVLYRSQS